MISNGAARLLLNPSSKEDPLRKEMVGGEERGYSMVSMAILKFVCPAPALQRPSFLGPFYVLNGDTLLKHSPSGKAISFVRKDYVRIFLRDRSTCFCFWADVDLLDGNVS